MTERPIQNIRFDERGLIPAIVQDAATGEIISFRYMDNGSLLKTLQTGETTFSIVGAGEGGPQKSLRLIDVRINPDGGSLTVLVERDEAAPAESKPVSLLSDIKEAQSARGSEVSLVDVGSMEFGLAMNRLYSLITDRRDRRPDGSYTTYLFNSGLDKILKKIAEESGEVIIAAKNRSQREITSELADLYFHLLVLMVERDVTLGDVHRELERRAAQAPRHE